ncbi:MAG: tyrosine--tRNA ligase, partial [Phycisphaerae bacterium]|nr:tyrosine--tRNA ligase [Phycisphaerae bacterium]
MAANILKELQWRGLVDQTSDPELERILGTEKLTVYAGFDPSSSSLQIGNLVGILALRRFQQAGHRPIALLGGATGMIGDPSGKDAERNLLGPEAVKANIAKIRGQLEHFLGSSDADNGVIIVDNAEWLGRFGLIEFLRDVGKNFRVGYMLGKESVRRRIGDSKEGMSYTEFSYMLLQAYDFAHLFSEYGC